MADKTVLERLKIELNIKENDVISLSLLDNSVWQASEMIKNKRRSNILENRFYSVQYRIALILWNKRGMEGQATRSEGGVSISFDDIQKILRDEVPTLANGGS